MAAQIARSQNAASRTLMQRRRFITILASTAAGLSLGKLGASTPKPLEAVRWQGYTLGAQGRFTLYTKNRAAAQIVLQRCFAEIRRLESLFSLYDHHSELCRLNRDGRLDSPAADWLPLLDIANNTHRYSEGLFDPTVQGLWRLYAGHFAKHPEARAGPGAEALATALQNTGWRHVEYSPKAICFDRPGLQLTLNGIAQGYITDRITELLKDAGYEHVLVELGETRAIGAHPEQRPWQIGIKDATNSDAFHTLAELNNNALATSGSYGSPLSKDGNYHHLIHPKTGLPASRWKSLSVIAPSAAEADAFSTGLSFASESQILGIERRSPHLKIIKQG
jgi:thiamine biosynthesis lipoprotein